nr:MAG TPA: putative inner membrane protein [Caudoviricetes sp.]
MTFSERRDTKRAYSIIVGVQLSSFFIFPGAVFCFLSRSSGIFFEIFGVKKDEPG